MLFFRLLRRCCFSYRSLPSCLLRACSALRPNRLRHGPATRREALLNATFGNLTELIIALAALQAGEYVLVKASLAGAIVANTLFMMGASFFLGGLKHHIQQFNSANARLQVAMLFLAAFGLFVPSAIAASDPARCHRL